MSIIITHPKMYGLLGAQYSPFICTFMGNIEILLELVA